MLATGYTPLLASFRPSNSHTIWQFLQDEPVYTHSIHNITAVKGLKNLGRNSVGYQR